MYFMKQEKLKAINTNLKKKTIMDILLEATKRVQKDIDKLTTSELIKMDLYTYKNHLMNFYIKEIQEEIKNKLFKEKEKSRYMEIINLKYETKN